MAKKQPQSTALALYDEEFAADAAASADQVASISTQGTYVTVERGKMVINDADFQRAGVVVVGASFVYDYVDGPRTKEFQMPVCFAIGEVGAGAETLSPHEGAPQPQGDDEGNCKGCPQNQFGSAATGKGKACRNRIRLAFLQAGRYNDDGGFEQLDDEEFLQQEVFFIMVPTTSIKSWTQHVNGLKTNLNRGPAAVITQIASDEEAEYPKVDFSFEEKIPNTWWERIKTLRTSKEVTGPLTRPFEAREDDGNTGGGQRAKGKPAAKAKGKPTARPVAAAPKRAPQRQGSRF